MAWEDRSGSGLPANYHQDQKPVKDNARSSGPEATSQFSGSIPLLTLTGEKAVHLN